MSEENALEIKEKIISIFKDKGPCLPVNVAKETGLSILFASAFLSEFLAEKKIKISSMKVGNSPLYFIPGQEKMLENFSKFLQSREKEAFILLKKKKILKDSKQEPAIRVALREIKDFAIPFKKNEEIYWRYFDIPEKDLKNLEKSVKKSKKIKKRKKITQTKKPKEKSIFSMKILNFLKEKNIDFIKEIESKKKELVGIVKMNTFLNEIEFLMIAKDKKKITKSDIKKALHKGNSYKRMILFISNGEIEKKALEYFSKYKNIIKFLKIRNQKT